MNPPVPVPADRRETAPAASPGRRAWLLFAGLGILLAGNWVAAVVRFQPNVMFLDQWAFYEPLFRGAGTWARFTEQLGPHRQGLAFVFTSWILEATAWDERWNSLWIVALLVLAAGLALALKRRLAGGLRGGDAWMLLAILSLGSYELVLTTPNASHSIFALVLALLWGCTWLARRAGWRYLGAGALVFLLTFSGFGLFGAVMGTVLLAIDGVRQVRARAWRKAALAGAGLALAAAGGVWFAIGYVPDSGSAGLRMPGTSVFDHVRFVLLMLPLPAGIVGESAAKYLVGLALATVLVVTAVAALRRWRRADQDVAAWEVVLFLFGTSALFVSATAVGRVSLGVDAGSASRYLPLSLGLWLAVDFAGAISGRRGWAATTKVVVWGLVLWPYLWSLARPLGEWPGTFGLKDNRVRDLESYATRKAEWADAYLKSGDWRQALEQAGVPMFPPLPAEQLQARLDFLREKRLSFFAGGSDTADYLPWGVTGRSIWNDTLPFRNAPQPCPPDAQLTFITRRAGFAAVTVRARANEVPGTVTLAIASASGNQRVVLDTLPGRVVVPVRAGFNPVDFRWEASAAAAEASVTGVLLGPVRFRGQFSDSQSLETSDESRVEER